MFRYGVLVDGCFFPLVYEEMVELLASGRDSTHGNEYHKEMKEEVKEMFKKLPVSNY